MNIEKNKILDCTIKETTRKPGLWLTVHNLNIRVPLQPPDYQTRQGKVGIFGAYSKSLCPPVDKVLKPYKVFKPYLFSSLLITEKQPSKWELVQSQSKGIPKDLTNQDIYCKNSIEMDMAADHSLTSLNSQSLTN